VTCHTRFFRLALACSVMVAGFELGVHAQPSYAPPNGGLPNPYRSFPNWAKLPDGRQWGATAGVAIAPDGKVWGIDRCGTQHSCYGSKLDPIIEFDQAGKPLRKFGADLFEDPHGLFIDRDGNVWVTDEKVSDDKKVGVQVIKFTPDGKVLMRLGKAGVMGQGSDTFGAPSSVAIAANGDILIADGHDNCTCPNARIMKFTKDGKFLKQWGKKGSAPGEFDGLHGLALDSRGRVFVADRGNNRVQVFTPEGEFVAAWKQFGRPSGLAIDQNDMLYVSDSQSNDKINPVSKRGIRIGSIKDGKVTAFIPDPDPKGITSTAEGLAVDRQGTIYGAENGSHDIIKHAKK
jgi:sugar lactone lactonase YvrE